MARRSRATAEQAYLDHALARFSPEVAATAHAGLLKLRKLFPGARQLVYDRSRELPIGFAPAQRGSALFSLVVYSRWVRFFFLEGVLLNDPEGRLEGTGNQVRSIRLDPSAAILDDPYILCLITQAMQAAGADLCTGSGGIELKSKL